MIPQLSKWSETDFKITVINMFNKIDDKQENFYRDLDFII